MTWLHRILPRLRYYLDREQVDGELDDEMRHHYDLLVEKHERAGMTPLAARRAAAVKFGNRTVLAERQREQLGLPWFDALWQDLSYGGRALRRNPGFTLVVVLSLALGIGATTSVFTLARATLLAPLPYPDADRLVMYVAEATPGIMNARDTVPISMEKFRHLRASVPAFEDVGASAAQTFVLESDGAAPAQRVLTQVVTSGALTTLGIRPLLGRLFEPREDSVAPPIAIIGHTLWQNRFGGRPDVLGRTVRIAGTLVTIVGVMPDGYRGLTVDPAEMWMPFGALTAAKGFGTSPRALGYVNIVARVRQGVRPEVLQAQLDAQILEAERLFPTRFPPRLASSTWRAGVLPLAEARHHPLLRPLGILLAVAVGLVLTIVCANAASLLLARAQSRRGELGVRLALGASRGRIVRQLLTESVLLATLGGVAGIVLSVWATRAIAALRPELPPSFVLLRNTDLLAEASLAPDWRVLAFAAVLTFSVGLIAGLWPALSLSRTASQMRGASHTRTVAAGARGRAGLVVAELTLATVLLIGAGLVTRSFLRLLAIDPGFRADNVVAISIGDENPRRSAQERGARRDALLASVGAVPGVERVGTGSCTPLGNGCMMGALAAVDDRRFAPEDMNLIEIHEVNDEFLSTLGIRLVSGRGFDRTDHAGSPAVALVNETAARQYWPGGSALGRTFVVGDTGQLTVVGVVPDVKYEAIDKPSMPAYYTSERQQVPGGSVGLYVRTRGDPAAMIPALRAAIRASAPGWMVREARTMRDVTAKASASTRFVASLLGAFAAIACFLAMLGVYGVLAYTVTQRSREFGVRMALGAEPRAVLHLVFRQGLALIIAGVLAGTIGAYLGSGLLDRFLFGIGRTDLATFAAVAVLLAAAGCIAVLVPAVRATRVDPLSSLRSD